MNYETELEVLVAEVTEELRERGNAENTIIRHQRVFAQFVQFAESRGERYYSEELVRLFLEERRNLSALCGPRFMEQYTIALNKLADKVDGQPIQLKHWSLTPFPELKRFGWAANQFEERIQKRLKNYYDVRSRMKELYQFLALLEANNVKKLAEINAEHIADAFRETPDKPRFHSAICEFLRFAVEMGWMPLDLSYFVPRVRQHKTVPSVYSPTEIEKALSCIDRTTRSGKRKRAVLLIISRLGLRNTDACELTFSNVDWSKKMISIIQRKTGVPLSLPLLPEIEDALKDYIAVRPQSDLPYIFLRNRAPYLPLRNTTVDYELRALFAQAGINTEGKKRGAHSLRASLASALLDEGVSYPVIQKTLGHSSPNATKYYTKIDIKRLRDCALEVPPPSGHFAELLGEV